MSTAIHLALSPQQVRGMLRVIDPARPHLPLLLPDPIARDAVVRGVEAMRRAVARAESDAPPREGHDPRLVEVLGQIDDAQARVQFADRARDVRVAATMWVALEEAADVAWARGDVEAVRRCAALLQIDAIDEAAWRGEAIELLDALEVAFVLPTEGQR